jgi:hypothetical protein
MARNSRLRDEQLYMYSMLPNIIAYRSEDPRLTDPAVLYAKLLIRLEHLLNMFLIERLRESKHIIFNDFESDMLAISFELVSLTLIFWVYRDIMSGFQSDFEWIVSSRPPHRCLLLAY